MKPTELPAEIAGLALLTWDSLDYGFHRDNVLKVLAAVLPAHERMVREQVAAEHDRLKAVLRDLTDPDPCWFDHNGGCQAHGYLWLEPGERCPHAEAKELLQDAPTAPAQPATAPTGDTETPGDIEGRGDELSDLHHRIADALTQWVLLVTTGRPDAPPPQDPE